MLTGRGSLLRFGELLHQGWLLKAQTRRGGDQRHDRRDLQGRAGRQRTGRQVALALEAVDSCSSLFRPIARRLFVNGLPISRKSNSRPALWEPTPFAVIRLRRNWQSNRFAKPREEPVDGIGPTLDDSVLILAGGLGTRLRSVLVDRPKGLADIGSRRFLEIRIELLRDQGAGGSCCASGIWPRAFSNTSATGLVLVFTSTIPLRASNCWAPASVGPCPPILPATPLGAERRYVLSA